MDNQDCNSCLDADCAWIGGSSCQDDCIIVADTTCVKSDTTTTRQTNTDLCAADATATQDRNLCAAIGDDCETCLSTMTLADGGTCVYFGDTAQCCTAECFFPGNVYSETCPTNTTTTTDCETLETCEACLSVSCGWAGSSSCLPFCAMIADVQCWEITDKNMTQVVAVCQQAHTVQLDEQTCAAATDCRSCVTALLSDRSTGCQWYTLGDESNTHACCLGGDCFLGGGGGKPTTECPVQGTLCDTQTTCTSCLEMDCVWGLGSCLDSCDDLAVDATTTMCYNKINFPTSTTTEEICQMQEETDADIAMCKAVTDCATCTSTLQSDGVSTCAWYQDGNERYCGIGGECDDGDDNNNGVCGQDVCPRDNPDCVGKASCTECLDVDSACAWAAGSCITSCNIIADTSCYSVENIVNNKTKTEICALAAADEADEETCGMPGTCAECTSTVKADGSSTCQWFKSDDGDGGFCGKGGCDVRGQCGGGSDTCDDDASCSDQTTCESCLEMSSSCAWAAVGSCLNSCSEIADDAGCYSNETFTDSSPAAICKVAAEQTANEAACRPATSCADCIAIELPFSGDSGSTCQWYSSEEADGSSSSSNWYCGTGGCDMNGVCGSSSCPRVSVEESNSASCVVWLGFHLISLLLTILLCYY